MERRIDRAHELGPALRDARKAKNLTQAELATAARVSRRFVSELEASQRDTAEFTRVMAVVRALDLQFLVVEAPPPGPDPFAEVFEQLQRPM